MAKKRKLKPKPKLDVAHGDMVRYLPVVFAGLVACGWLMTCYGAGYKPSVVYIMLVLISWVGYLVFRDHYKK